MSHRFKLVYKATEIPQGMTRDEVLAKYPDHGACDAAVILQLSYPEDGSFSVVLDARDGRTGGVLDDAEVFKAWILLAERLGRSETLDGRREFARSIFEGFMKAMQDGDLEEDGE